MATEESTVLLNSRSYTFLVSYEEAREKLDLQLVVHETRAEKDPSQIEIDVAEIDQILVKDYAVRTDPSFREFTSTFETYVGFLIRNEHYIKPEPEEDYSKMLRSYSKSKFIDFIAGSTFALKILDEPILHFALVCSDLVIDVACPNHPKSSSGRLKKVRGNQMQSELAARPPPWLDCSVAANVRSWDPRQL